VTALSYAVLSGGLTIGTRPTLCITITNPSDAFVTVDSIVFAIPCGDGADDLARTAATIDAAPQLASSPWDVYPSGAAVVCLPDNSGLAARSAFAILVTLDVNDAAGTSLVTVTETILDDGHRIQSQLPLPVAKNEPGLAITSFVPDLPVVTPGTRVRLGWTTTGAETLELSFDGASYDVYGRKFYDVYPGATNTYLLVATGASDVVKQWCTVLVTSAEARLVGTRTKVPPGTPVTLSWEISNAQSAILQPLNLQIDPPVNGSHELSKDHQTVSTEYQLDVYGAAEFDHVTASAWVHVQEPLATLDLERPPPPPPSPSPPPFAPVVLRWSASYAEHVEINGTAVPAVGTREVAPTATTTYTLVASGTNGRAAPEQTVVVPVAPMIERFAYVLDQATKTPCIAWTARNARTARLDGAEVPLTGQTSVINSERHTLELFDDAGRRVATAELYFRLAVLSARPKSLAAPGAVQLNSWVVDASAAAIRVVDPTGYSFSFPVPVWIAYIAYPCSSPGTYTFQLVVDGAVASETSVTVGGVRRRSAHAWIGRLDVAFRGGAIRHGTGTLIGPNHVLTCAHNLYDPANGGWPTSVTFALADGAEPVHAAHVHVPAAFQQLVPGARADHAHDYGLVALASPLDPAGGAFPRLAVDAAPAARIEIAGCSDDPTSAREALANVNNGFLYDGMGMSVGRVGSAVRSVVADVLDVPHLIGIHVAGDGGAQRGIAVRITTEVEARIRDWMRR
jgi:hypothetical protein